jgi:hypothetical protein
VCLSASVPALGRTRHPFAVSGLEGPSPKIEFNGMVRRLIPRGMIKA